MPIVVMADDTRYAVVADHLNTPRRATHPDGGLIWQWGYSASGDEQPTVAGRRFNKVAALESDFSINLRYPGQYFDVESGLHYNWFRTYNPTVGRYTQGDPIGLDGGWNRFGYVDANPLMFTDPMGLANSAATQWMRPSSSVAPADTTFQVGLSGNLGASVIGLAGEIGAAFNSRGDDFCVYVQGCGVAGPQIVASCGLSYSAGDGLPSSGVSTSQGATWFGGTGIVGAGQISVNDAGQLQGTRGGARGQVGVGAGAGYTQCTQRTWCVRR